MAHDPTFRHMRRAVLTGGLGGLFTALFAKKSMSRASSREILIQENASFVSENRDARHRVAEMKPGEHLVLNPRANRNRWFPNGIAVFTTDGQRIGSVQPMHSEVFGRLLEAGCKASARVVRVRPDLLEEMGLQDMTVDLYLVI